MAFQKECKGIPNKYFVQADEAYITLNPKNTLNKAWTLKQEKITKDNMRRGNGFKVHAYMYANKLSPLHIIEVKKMEEPYLVEYIYKPMVEVLNAAYGKIKWYLIEDNDS